ncbi:MULTISPECIES: ATP-grasp domain-containing protein [Ignavibacterium]|jgi:D-alanine-D-alanine ligase|uniref:D-alanine--D-alanine ligase family protein n=1 Tax=Ignavibacterium TaxID=795750 RepID=UPI0025C08115|nr:MULTISPECIES: ATP-grasp domain-containing protein [Ignavibacterium]
MKQKNLKVAIVYNEPHPELYKIPSKKQETTDFEPYFEVEKITPMEEYDLMAERLSKAGFSAYSLNIKDNIFSFIEDYTKNKPDVVFNFIEIYKDKPYLEMNVVSLYELLGVAYTGAPPMALANCQNKQLAKRILASEGILTPSFTFFDKLQKEYKHNLKYPLIVKPAFEDASVGIENSAIVNDGKSLKKRIEFVFAHFKQPALCEEYIDGRELNVAVLGDVTPAALPISEIDFSQMPDHLYNIVSYQAKWDPFHEAYHKTIPVCPAKLPKRVETHAKEIAVKAFRIMGVRDYARVDMRLSKDNKLYVLEVNPNPDLTEDAGFMRSSKAAGYSYVKTLSKIILFAHKRAKRSKSFN